MLDVYRVTTVVYVEADSEEEALEVEGRAGGEIDSWTAEKVEEAEPEVEPETPKVVQDAAWLAYQAAEVWPVAVGAEGRLAAAGGELTPRGAAVRSALRTALALEAEGATVRAARQLWRALDAARA